MSNKRSGGFTLIELLVVVAIIALLISILLPGLSEAREAARVAVDLSNQKQLCLSTNTYLTDGNSDLVFAFPFDHSMDGQTSMNLTLITEFVWGGGIPDKDLNTSTWSATGLDAGDNPYVYKADFLEVTPRARPLNRYVSSSVSWDDPSRVGRTNSRRWQRPMDLPGVFKCPSDRTVATPEANQTNRDQTLKETGKSSWEYWGTSFAINWYWPYYYAGTQQVQTGARPGNQVPYQRRFDYVLAGRGTYASQAGFKSLGSYMLKDKGGRWASEFVLFQENRLNFALEGARPRGVPGNRANEKQLVGWHRKLNRHVASYLDGSARSERYDTRYVDGSGWTTWPNKPWIDGWEQYNDD